MPCTFSEARDYMLSVFKAAWDTTGNPAVYEGVARTPDTEGNIPDAPVWARATIRHADGFQSSLTGPLEVFKKFENIGVVIVQVFARIGDGASAAYDAAQLVATAYRVSRNLPVWFRNVRINEIGTKGEFHQINVIADFTYETVESETGATPPAPIAPPPSANIGPFYFNTPQLQWVINHNMGRRVGAEAYTLGGVLIWAQVTQVSDDQTIVSFDTPQSGYAIIDY